MIRSKAISILAEAIYKADRAKVIASRAQHGVMQQSEHLIAICKKVEAAFATDAHEGILSAAKTEALARLKKEGLA